MRLSTSSSTYKGLSPESEDPPAPEVEAVSTSLEPKELTIEEYHDTSDLYIDNLVAKLEELAEEREDVDVEYSVLLCPLQSLYNYSMLTRRRQEFSL